MLNEVTEQTKGIIHIMVTNLCARNCPHCCNKQYDLNSIPYVTDEELKEAHTILITGGEPFLFSEPNEIARYYKENYPNIKNVYVYGNALEFHRYCRIHSKDKTGLLSYIDGVSISIKNSTDLLMFESLVQKYSNYLKGKSNFLYNFLDGEPYVSEEDPSLFKIIKRSWQEEFEPSNDSIFRKA
jgi:hypothetical protein